MPPVKNKSLADVRPGAKTRSIRLWPQLWPRCRRRAGQRSYILGAGSLRVLAVDLEAISDAEAIPTAFLPRRRRMPNCVRSTGRDLPPAREPIASALRGLPPTSRPKRSRRTPPSSRKAEGMASGDSAATHDLRDLATRARAWPCNRRTIAARRVPAPDKSAETQLRRPIRACRGGSFQFAP